MPVRELRVSSDRKRQALDITADVAEAIGDLVGDGMVCISAPHCTCAVYVNENEEGLVQDTLAVIERATQGSWMHDRIDDNAAAHLGASLLGSSVCLPVRGGRLVLGTWQRVMLVELDGPRRRTVHVTITTG